MDRFTQFRAVSKLLTQSAFKVDLDTIDWPYLMRLSGSHLISPALYVHLLKHPQSSKIPKETQEFLEATYTLNKYRNQAIRTQAIDLARLLNAHGIEPLLLKGAANMLSGLYTDPAIRIAADIDFYVRKWEAAKTLYLLKKHGYVDQATPNFGKYRTAGKHYHYLPLEHREYVAQIELHDELFSRHLPPVVTTMEMNTFASTRHLEGVKFSIPSKEMRLLHTIVHAQLHDSEYKFNIINLRYLYDFALLGRTSTGIVDWQNIQWRFYRFGLEEMLRSYLFSAKELLGFQTPVNIHFSSDTKRWFTAAVRQINRPRRFRYKVITHKLRTKYHKLFDYNWYRIKFIHRKFIKVQRHKNDYFHERSQPFKDRH